MLRALKTDGGSALAWEAVRGQDYRCPVCSEVVVLKQGRIVAHHFAHRPDSGCAFGVGESERHMAMKQQMGELLSCFERGRVEYEVPLVDGRRADVLAYPTPGQGGPPFEPWAFVVECQSSALSCEEWDARTAAYNADAYPVLWVWDIERLGLKPGYTFRDARQDWPYENRVAAEVRACHDAAGGAVYALDAQGTVRSTQLHEPPSRYNEFQGDYVPKTKRTFTFTPTFLTPRPYEGANGEGLVHLDEVTWWKPKADPRVSRPIWDRVKAQQPAEVWWKPGGKA